MLDSRRVILLRPRRAAALCAAVTAALGLGACGGGGGAAGSPDAAQVLEQTFSGTHSLNSGRVLLTLQITPSGSSTLTAPITLSLGGPFQSRGRGKLPASAFSLSASALGRTGSISLISTGTAGYVTLQGTSYQVPAATFQKLEASFSGLTGSEGTGTSHLAGVHPLRWVEDPQTVGGAQVGGASTTHVRAAVNVSRLLADLSSFAQHQPAAASAGALSQAISPATRQSIAREVQNPTVDIWSGRSDHMLRRLQVSLTLPVSGQVSSALGGLRSASIAFTLAYSQINQPQSVNPPAALKPFSQFQAKMQTFLAEVQSAAGSLTGGSASSGSSVAPGGSSSGGAATSGGSTTSGGSVYQQCIAAAAGDVAKMQRCAPLLGGG